MSLTNGREEGATETTAQTTYFLCLWNRTITVKYISDTNNQEQIRPTPRNVTREESHAVNEYLQSHLPGNKLHAAFMFIPCDELQLQESAKANLGLFWGICDGGCGSRG